MKKPKLLTVDFTNLEEGKDYTILTEDIMDDDFNTYYKLSNALRKVKNQNRLTIVRDLPDPEASEMVRYEIDKDAEVSIDNAKLCSFGVLVMLSGDFKGIQFMFPLVNMDSEELFMHLFAYSILTHQYADQVTLRRLLKDQEYRAYFQFTLDHVFYDVSNPYFYMVEKLVEIHPNLFWMINDAI
jgi:hypothetical protein